jgi:hypothetical protein
MPPNMTDAFLQQENFQSISFATSSMSMEFVAPSKSHWTSQTGTKLVTFCEFRALWPTVLRYNSAALHHTTFISSLQQSLLYIACNHHIHLELYYENTASVICTKAFYTFTIRDMSLFVLSTDSIIGISIRKETLGTYTAKEIFKFVHKAMYNQHAPREYAVNTARHSTPKLSLTKNKLCTLTHTRTQTHTHWIFCIYHVYTPPPPARASARPFSHRNFLLYLRKKIKLFVVFYTQHHTNSCSDILDANVLEEWKH